MSFLRTEYSNYLGRDHWILPDSEIAQQKLFADIANIAPNLFLVSILLYVSQATCLRWRLFSTKPYEERRYQ